MNTVTYKPIGTIHSPFNDIKDMPIQSTGAHGVRGIVEIDPSLAEGLKDLDGFSHIFMLYSFHLSTDYKLTVVPFLDDTPRGVFATRAPRRPNSIGLSVVRLDRIEGTTLHILDVDVLDGTPLLDIKPYVPAFDVKENCRVGWLADKDEVVKHMRSDERFAE